MSYYNAKEFIITEQIKQTKLRDKAIMHFENTTSNKQEQQCNWLNHPGTVDCSFWVQKNSKHPPVKSE